MADYSARFHEKFILKKETIFVKLKKQNVVCAHEFYWFAKKVVCTTYDILMKIKISVNLKRYTFLHFFIKELY